MSCFKALLLERVYVRGEEQQIFVEKVLLEYTTYSPAVWYKTVAPVFIIVFEHEVIDGSRESIELVIEINGFFQESLAIVDKRINMMEPFGNSIVLKRELSFEHEFAKTLWIAGLVGIEAWEGQVL